MGGQVLYSTITALITAPEKRINRLNKMDLNPIVTEDAVLILGVTVAQYQLTIIQQEYYVVNLGLCHICRKLRTNVVKW